MRLMPLGWRRAMLLMGVIWGTWHWPILYFGYNYGLDVPGAPWSGMLAFVVFTWAAGTVLAWLSLRAGSVWPAVIGHGAINAGAGLGILFSQGDPNKLLGPMPFGLIAVIPWALVALWLLLRPGPLGETPPQPVVEVEMTGQPA
jgi:membrane protease YdiL (CAAX protease family)